MRLSPSRPAAAHNRVGVAALLSALVAATLALGLTSPAQAVPSTGLMITEVYPGGGNASATYNADFIELYNASASPISLAGKSLQYRATTNTGVPSGTNLFALPAVSVPAGSYFLVKGGSGATGVDFPKSPDAISSIAMGASAGQIYLADSATGIQPVTGAASVAAGGTIDYSAGKVIDFFGYGTGTTSYETALKSGTITTAGSYKRAAGPVDTDNNNTDFTISAVSPGPDNCDCVAPVLKISEVYTEGGSAGAAYSHDFVEIQNPGTATVSMTGLSLQYRAPAATGAAAVVVPLSGSMAAGSFDVVELASAGANGVALTDPQYNNHALDLATSGGTLTIVKNNASGFDPGTGAFAANQYVADLVGWGSSNVSETTPVDITDVTAATSVTRAAGSVDTNVNLDDFFTDVPRPDASAVIPAKTIAEIQGTAATTPMNGATVQTTGVVTAAYPHAASTDFRGFYIQTAGHDAANDTTPNASDALFVFTSNANIAPAVGDKVTLTSAKVSEFAGMTELTVTNPANVVNAGPATGADVITPGTVLPGTDCALPGNGCLSGAALEAEREKHEGEVFAPTAPFTVSDSYDGTPWAQVGNRGFQMAGEIGLAANDTQPLIAPTQVHNPSTDPAGLVARNAYNAAHMITLDDGNNLDFSSTAGEDIAFPWLTPTHTVRMGAAVTFPKPVVLDYRNDLWKLQPQGKVVGDGETFVSIQQDRPAAPDDVLGVDGDLKIATFNMLNYFNTTGEAWDTTVARHCTYYTDRDNNRISNNTCEEDSTDPITGLPVVLPGPRGAANQVSFERQEAKELEAINTMNADVMSLEEVENSTKIGDADRDDAVIRLVQQLNAHWAAAHPTYVGQRWAYAPSPRAQAQPTITEQDAIRSAFIYNPQQVELVGPSRILLNSAPFRNAREPLAQAFKPLGSGRANAFGVIVNHFKSKGDSTGTATGDNIDKLDGAGAYNGDRKRQAAALVSFADQFMSDRQIDKMFLTGDYNAYGQEDPVKVITGAGYHDLHPANDEQTYSFAGLAGSLDHVFANEAAYDMVTGEDVWSINANESVFYEYSRYNSNLTLLYAVNPFRSSDHNPEIIGIDVGDAIPDPDVDTVQILATNDFHGRLLDNPVGAEAGAASLAGAVKQLRADNPDTVFAAAGDLIGASTFESFVAHDKPTIDALNEAGLEVSAAGNHEFDQGYVDLVNRVMAPESAANPDGGAQWQYIAANVRMKDDHSAALPETWYTTLSDGRTVGFVGAVTEDLPALVAGDGIAELEITDIVDSVNTYADQLKSPGGCGVAEGCDLVIELVHEGAATTAFSSVTDDSTFAHIVAGADENVDAIVSGHTHLAYNHKVPVQAWIDEGRSVTKRPVVSAGQYGANLNRLEFDFAPGTDDLLDVRQTVLALKDYDADPATQAIVDAAVDAAAAVGNTPLGDIEGPFVRAQRNDPVTGLVGENRGGESTLGNLVAEIQRWKTGADIAFMNPGGLRADLLGTAGTPRVLTYRQAADVQPFANTLVTMDLTGAQIKTILEQQWQRDADGNIPSRPFLRLGTSEGFASTYDASRPEGDRITGMWLHGDPVDPAHAYRVASTSFLASGTGDNFWGFAAATNEQDTGKTDLQGVVDYMAEFAQHQVDAPLPVDYRQHAVGVSFPAGAPATYATGDTVAFGLSSLAMTGTGDAQDSQVEVSLDGTVLGTFAVTNTLQDVPFDEAGTASVSVTLPAVPDGRSELVVRGSTTDTTVTVPILTSDGLPDTTVAGEAPDMVFGQPGSVEATVMPSAATGSVTVKDGTEVLGSASLSGGSASVALAAGSLAVGDHTLTLVYSGDAGHSGSRGEVDVTVVRATPVLTATPTPATVEVGTGTSDIAVTVSATGVDPTGTVTASVDGSVVDTATLAAGAATLTVGPFATTGDKTVTIDYAGDSDVADGSTTTTVSVTPPIPPPAVDTTTTATAGVMVYGTDGQVQVTVTSTKPLAGGSVQLLDGTTVLASGTLAADGKVTLTIPGTALPVGSHTLAVKYLGDAANKPSETTVGVTVGNADSTTQTTVTPAQVVVGQGTVTVRATVSATGFTPTGDVEVYVNNTLVATKTLSGGVAEVQVGPFATVANRSITVKYLGDATTRTSESAAKTVTVVKATPTMTVTTSPSRITTKDNISMTVALSASGQVVTGSVGILYDGRVLTGNLSNGSVTFALGKQSKAGSYNVRILYGGSALAETVTRTVTLEVLKK